MRAGSVTRRKREVLPWPWSWIAGLENEDGAYFEMTETAFNRLLFWVLGCPCGALLFHPLEDYGVQ